MFLRTILETLPDRLEGGTPRPSPSLGALSLGGWCRPGLAVVAQGLHVVGGVASVITGGFVILMI